MRDHIISEICRLAKKNGGQPPGWVLFNKETAIGERQWRGKIWARWSDALADAGFKPNQKNERLDSEELLAGVIVACRHFQKVPTEPELQMLRRNDARIPSLMTLRSHFKSRDGLIAALRKKAADADDLSDIALMLPIESSADSRASANAPEGFVYLIQSGDFYKIGRSEDIERRMKEIRVALPDKATLVHSIRTDDPAGIEAYWHNRFKDRRANGEWFKLSALDLAAFKKRKFQ